MSAHRPLETDQDLAATIRREGPINLPRAYEVMARRGLAGLVLGDPLNVFHVLGYWPQIARTKAGFPPTTFALLSRDPNAPPAIVTSRFIYYYTYADGGFERPVQAFLFNDSADDGDLGDAPEVELFPDRGLSPPTEVEQRRRLAINAVPADQRSIRDAGAALVRRMRDMGLWSGVVAYDHPLIAKVCAHHDRPRTLIEADNVLREIRIVKSPLEISLMRRASAANVAAVAKVGESIRAGAAYSDLRAVFEAEAVRGGNKPVFLTIDRVSSELVDDRVLDGQALFIDGVSHYQNYHGDYARTVFVGEGRASARRAAEAMRQGWMAVRERLRPGLRYSEITRIGTEAVRKAGYDGPIGFTPHSVGLMHTDEPGVDAGGFYRKADLVLQKDMILSVDCPVLETGIGGSAHIEDLTLITADGGQPIHPVSEHVITV